MKDIAFGEKIYQHRKSLGLSQKQLGKELGVSDKAVSKWETGEAYPQVSQLVYLSKLFDVSLDSLLISENLKPKSVHKIVITGGPCGGKSTAMSYIQNEFTKRGFAVLIVPETATELVLAGISPNKFDNMGGFEDCILSLQLAKEKVVENAIANMNKYDKFLIICDRGVMDCKVYLSDLQFKNCVKKTGISELKLRDSYDAVFHLVSAAKGAKEFYNFDNLARRETLEEAVTMDEKTLNAWVGHPHLRVIDNSTDFKTKMRRLLKEVASFLGEPAPYEIERKFLIDFPPIDKLEKMENCSKVEIVQTYLESKNGEEVRIRQRGQNGEFIYTKTTKIKVSDVKRLETETRISEQEYLNLMTCSDTAKTQIRKTRYCLLYKNQYFEIDVYPFWKNKAIMEIELQKENQEVDFPKFIKIEKEVTGINEYYNAELAKTVNKGA